MMSQMIRTMAVINSDQVQSMGVYSIIIFFIKLMYLYAYGRVAA